jgi:hypothetical protein
MSEWFPRIADIKSIEDLSKVLAYPMIIAAHILQSGLTLSAPEINIHYAVNLSSEGYTFALTVGLVIIAKAIFICLGALAIHFLISLGQHLFASHFPFLQFISALVMGLSLAGVLGQNTPIVDTVGLKPAWYYAAFIFAFYLLAWQKDNKVE